MGLWPGHSPCRMRTSRRWPVASVLLRCRSPRTADPAHRGSITRGCFAALCDERTHFESGFESNHAIVNATTGSYCDIGEFQNLDWLRGLEELHFLDDEHLPVVICCFHYRASLFKWKNRRVLYLRLPPQSHEKHQGQIRGGSSRALVHQPVPMNITLYCAPSAACTWLTTMRVNGAPLRIRRGFPPIGWIAWSMRGLSLIN